MKYFALVLLLVAIVCCEASKKEKNKKQSKEESNKFLEKITKECSEEIKFDLETGMKLLLGDLTIRSEEAKCFVRCVFKKEGFLNENDEAQVETIVEALTGSVNIKRKILTKLLEKCAKLESENPCDSAFKLLECYVRGEKAMNKAEL